jgi:hypothetical protein
MILDPIRELSLSVIRFVEPFQRHFRNKASPGLTELTAAKQFNAGHIIEIH